jgi:hypothetical protein
MRTTSVLERTHREARRTCRQAVTFGSLQGADVALDLHVHRLGETWWGTSQEVFCDLKHLSLEPGIHYHIPHVIDKIL